MTLSRDFAWLLGELAALAHLAIATAVTVHVLLNKRNVGASISWMGIAWLSPFVGGALYFALGVNRVNRAIVAEVCRDLRFAGRDEPRDSPQPAHAAKQ